MADVPIIDGHNDVLLRLWMKKHDRAAQDFLEGDGLGHIDLPRLKAGNMRGGFFAIFAPDLSHPLPGDDDDLNPPFDPPLPHELAFRATMEMVDILKGITASGQARLCLTAGDMRQSLEDGVLGMVFHIEGAEAIGPKLEGLQALHDAGLRSLGPVWSRANVFGTGVPFRFPSSPDTGPGLTDAGRALIRACNDMRIMIDLSHITEKGFWDVAKLSNAPLVATHSNAHAVCASSRNLTDDQLRAIGERGGMVGLNFATGFLRDDGRWTTDTGAEVMIRHLDHMLHLAGEDCVGLGSDFDGARIPGFIGTAAGLPRLVAAMQAAGYGEGLIEKLCFRNWLRVMDQCWGQQP